MTIKEAYVCPVCGNEQPTITGIQALTEDVRYDSIQCSQCQSAYRVYYKTCEVTREVTYVPSQTFEIPEDVEVPVAGQVVEELVEEVEQNETK